MFVVLGLFLLRMKGTHMSTIRVYISVYTFLYCTLTKSSMAFCNFTGKVILVLSELVAERVDGY